MASTDQRSYDSYIKQHEAQYGKQPAYIKVDFKAEVMGKQVEEIRHTKILGNLNAMTFITENGNIYECEESGWTWQALKILDKEAYGKYKAPMPYNVYIAG